MIRTLSSLLVVTISVSYLFEATGEIITFNAEAFAPGDPVDDQAAQTAYLNAVAAAGYSTFSEGFIGSQWDSVRSPVTATSVVSRGINWHSSDGDFITTVIDSDVAETRYQIYSKGTAFGGLHAVPATIIGESNTMLYGIGMWVDASAPKGKLHVVLDDTIDLKFRRVIGYDENPPDPPEPTKETVRLTHAKQFFGVLAPQGFMKFQLIEVGGTLEDAILMWATDFTFAVQIAPSTDGDLDDDGSVNDRDLNLLLSSFDSPPSLQNDVDLETLLGNFGRTDMPVSLSSVPEPSTLTLLAIGAVGLLAYGRRRRS
jgi:hypothetical protein